MSRSVSQLGLKLIANHEAIVNHIYICPAGYPTIGVGHLCLDGDYYLKGNSVQSLLEFYQKYPSRALVVNKTDSGFSKSFFVKIGQGWNSSFVITESDSLAIFKKDLTRFCLPLARNFSIPLTDNQFSACVSLAFNIGVGSRNSTRGFLSSSLFRNINTGRFDLVRDGFSRYIYANGKILQGLINRRKEEADLFFTPDNISDFPKSSQKEIRSQYEKYMIKRSSYF